MSGDTFYSASRKCKNKGYEVVSVKKKHKGQHQLKVNRFFFDTSEFRWILKQEEVSFNFVK